jgi:indolepyruvate ferredoxin oxidoreductase alpha subunit
MATLLGGEEAFVQAALDAGVRVVASYPGSPSSGVVERLARVAGERGLHVEWSANERVAFEVAVGASIAGVRALVPLKSVGLNVALDPVMVANLVGVEAGLVILLGDDPGAWGSQNDQDSRLLGMFAELPMMEPAAPQEGYDMLREAFRLSERVSLPVIVRETRTYAAYRAAVETWEPDLPPSVPRDIGHDRASRRWIASTDNAVALHERLHEKLERVRTEWERSPFNAVSGEGSEGVVAAGFAHRKAQDLLRDAGQPYPLRWLKVGTLHPFARGAAVRFLRGVRRALVLEENEPYVERLLKVVAQEYRLDVDILGRETGHIPWKGEFFRWQLADALRRFAPGCLTASEVSPSEEMDAMRARQKRGKPPGYLTPDEGLCDGCPYTPTFDILREALSERGEEAVFLADPGCGVRLRTKPFEMLDIKYSLSSCIGIACGIAQADPSRRVIAFPGDSAFFHTGITDLINAAYNRARILVLVLDNRTTALSGFEPHPGVGRDAMGRKRRLIRIEDLAAACQIDFVRVVNPREREATLRAFREALAWNDLAVVVARDPCPFVRDDHP